MFKFFFLRVAIRSGIKISQQFLFFFFFLEGGGGEIGNGSMSPENTSIAMTLSSELMIDASVGLICQVIFCWMATLQNIFEPL